MEVVSDIKKSYIESEKEKSDRKFNDKKSPS